MKPLQTYAPKELQHVDLSLKQVYERPDFGHHLMMTFDSACPYLVNSARDLTDAITPILEKHGCSIVNVKEQQFEPLGATVVWTLAESHFSIHTWPEHHACVVDFFTCQPHAEEICEKVREDLIDLFGAREKPESIVESVLLPRGKPVIQANKGEIAGQHHNTLLYDFEPLFEAKSPYQHVKVVDTGKSYYGRILLLDGIIQISDVEDMYSPTLMNPLLDNDGIRNVLIVGGGDCKIAKYMLNHYPQMVDNINIVDIDEMVTDAVLEHYPEMRFTHQESKKVQMHFKDAAVWIKNYSKAVANGSSPRFTGCIIDCTDPDPANGVSQSLFTTEFYQTLKDCLEPGAVVTQQYSHGGEFDVNNTTIAKSGYVQARHHICNQLEYSFPLNVVQVSAPMEDFATIAIDLNGNSNKASASL